MNGLNITKSLREIEYDIMNSKNIIKRTILINIYNIKKAQIIQQERLNNIKTKKKKKYRIKNVKKRDDELDEIESDDSNSNNSDDLSIETDSDTESKIKAYKDLIEENQSMNKNNSRGGSRNKSKNKSKNNIQPYDRNYEGHIGNDKMNNKMMERFNSEINFMKSNKSKQRISKPYENN